MPPVNTPHRKGMYDDYHQTLKPYIFHGVELSWRAGQVESVGESAWSVVLGQPRGVGTSVPSSVSSGR
jgi:hypothetical protein